jgi:hypothetical protein
LIFGILTLGWGNRIFSNPLKKKSMIEWLSFQKNYFNNKGGKYEGVQGFSQRR